MEVLLANPRGFCAGVDRAIEIVERAIQFFGAPIYVRHEVVHNRYVVDDLKQKGAIFVDELDQIPDDNYVIFSAHGVSKAVRHEAERRGLKVFDATCPLVTKVHMEVVRHLVITVLQLNKTARNLLASGSFIQILIAELVIANFNTGRWDIRIQPIDECPI